MRVLHIGNTAGVGSVIAKWQKKIFKTHVFLITRKQLDKFNVTTFGLALPLDKYTYTLLAIILSMGYDVVHIHDFDKLVRILKKIPFLRKKIVILHYHGTRIRGKWRERKKYWKYADKVIVSTPDLLENAPKKAIYLPNPIDIELFKPDNKKKHKNFAIYVYAHYKGEKLDWPKKIAKRRNLKLYIHDRKTKPIHHREFPKLLNLFEYLIDRNYIPSLSKTALEALACGLKVIRWDGKLVIKLPRIYHPETVVKKLYYIYLTPSHGFTVLGKDI